MRNDTVKDKLNGLLEEYRQVWEHYRQQDNMASNKEAIFAVAAFGVLAVTVSNDLTFFERLGAGFASLTLYIVHMCAWRHMHFHMDVAAYGIEKSERKINAILGHGSFEKLLDFQTNKEAYRDKMKEGERGIWGKPYFSIRAFQWYLMIGLGIAWLGVIFYPCLECLSHSILKFVYCLLR